MQEKKKIKCKQYLQIFYRYTAVSGKHGMSVRLT